MAAARRAATARPTISRPAASSAVRAGVRYPDIQYHFLPMAVTYDGKSLAQRARLSGPCRADALEEPRLGPARNRPIRARRRSILFNYMSHARRLGRDARLRAADARDFRADRLRSLSRPGDPAGRAMRQPTSEIDAFIRDRSRAPITPPAPARWARRTIRLAVVDRETRVIGVEGLRVVDSSIMPSITTRQSQRADHHDRREGRRHHPGRPAAARLQRALLRRARIGRRGSGDRLFLMPPAHF